MKFTKTNFNEKQTIVKGRTFEILGDSKDDYYSVFGATKEEVAKYQHKLDSFVPSKSQSGKFKKLSDAKKFIELVVGK